MNFQKVTFHCQDFHKIKMLYQTSFPKAERIPFWFLMLRTRFSDTDFLAFYEEGRFCGICCLNSVAAHTNLLYLAVDPALRSSGYGSKILNQICARYPNHTIALDIERPDAQAKNNEERLKRREFYLRNGYTGSGYGYSLFDVDYEILNIGEFDPEQWNKVVHRLYLGTLKLTLYPIDK